MTLLRRAPGVTNPLEVIEQITDLLFIRRLDDLHTLAENKATRTGKPIEKPVFPDGADEQGQPWSDLPWPKARRVQRRRLKRLDALFASLQSKAFVGKI